MLAKNFSLGEPWLKDTVYRKTGRVSFTIEVTDGRIMTRHLDQLREDYANNDHLSTADHDDDTPPLRTDHQLPADTNELRCSKRDKHPPQRFCD